MQSKNTIPLRVAEFYAKFPPFNKLPQQTLLDLANHTRVNYVKKNEVIFREDTSATNHFYCVRNGHIRLHSEKEDNKLYDVADEGDTFGIAAIMRDELYALTALAEEESLLFEIPWDFFKTILENHAPVALYFAAGFAAGYHKDIAQARVAQKAQTGTSYFSGESLFQEDDVIEIKSDKEPITCRPQRTIKEIAQKMTEHNIGSMVIVDEGKLPLGIVTDTDLRKKVATGNYSIETPISKIMSAPVFTLKKNLTVSQAIMQIVKNNIRHLVITEDGTPQSKIVTIISEHDLLLLHSNNPIVLIKEISQSNDVQTLKKIRSRAEIILKQYIEQNVSMTFLSEIISELNDAIITKCIALAQKTLLAENKISETVLEHPFAWLALGSEGRGEQLLLSDQDNAIVFADADTTEKTEFLKTQFSSLGKIVNDMLHNVGFEYCPAEVMARKWCMSVKQWKATFSGYMETPEPQAILHSSIFFDLRAVYGDKNLAQALKDHIHETLKKERSFLNFMAINALQNPPPLSFFKNFVVEKGGEHSNEFDIKARALMPLIDTARVLALELNCLEHSNTQQRYSMIAEKDNTLRQLSDEACYAHELLLRYRTLSGLRNKDSGRYINIDELGKIERQTLRSVFNVIERIQKMLGLRFQVERI